VTRPEIVYAPSVTVEAFQDDDAFIRGIRGPVGSGKSVGCVMDLYARLVAQPNSRWAVIRNTYRELADTTLATWLDWLRPFGEMKYSDMTWTCRNGAQVLFRALDRPDDIGKLLSLELTGAWVNEAREIPRPIIDMLQTRVGRYPSKREGGPDWFGIIMDTNSPDDFSWWYQLFEEVQPRDWRQYVQPGGREPGAENLANLPAGYYDRISQGKDQAWIDVYVGGQYGFIVDGRPVYPAWSDRVHAAQVARDPNLDLIVGVDWGLTPAAVFVQQDTFGQFRAVDELVTDDCSAVEFADLVGTRLRSTWNGHAIQVWGDPAGDIRSQVDKRTQFDVFKAAGIHAKPARTGGKNDNDIVLRVEAVTRNLVRLAGNGEPGLVVDPSCRYLRRAMAGGYKYRQMQISGDERFHAEPDKNIYSHVAEALQYALVGAGQARAVVGRDRAQTKPLDYRRMDKGLI